MAEGIEMNTIELNDQERRAINEFLGEHWGRFLDVAHRYLSDDEVDELGKKLEGQQ